MKPFISNATTALLVACAILVSAIAVRREFSRKEPYAPKPRAILEWRELQLTGQVLGDSNRPVTIVEFSDFQCPFCARAAESIREVRARYPDKVSFVYRHYPLTRIHAHAADAANAAECAAEQDAFERFHDLLFAEQDAIGSKSWRSYAIDSGVSDLEEFLACVEENRYQHRVTEDVRAGRRIGLSGTPSIIVNDVLLPGTPSTDLLEAYVLATLGDTSAMRVIAQQ